MRQFDWRGPASLALMVPFLLVCGCRSTMGPAMPVTLTAPSTTTYKAADFNADLASYRAKMASGDTLGATTLRNQIAYRVMGDIEMSYSKFEMSLTTQRAGLETGADAVQLGMSAAATLVGASDVKDILTATLTAFQGTRTSVDKNFYQQKTTESIISQMRTTRKTRQALIITSLAQRDVTSYPWDAVWIDLVDFYYAGTVPSALVEIASATGASATVANDKLNDAIAGQTKQAIDVRTGFEKLLAAANGTDASAVLSAVASMKSILKSTGYYNGENLTTAQVITLFERAMSEAAPLSDPSGAKLKALNAAVAAANIK